MMVRGVLVVLVPLLLDLAATVEGKIDFFSSSLRTKTLVQSHNQLLNIIREYAAVVEQLSSVLNRYTSEPEAAQVSEEWASSGDPLKTFLLIRRTTKDIDSIVTAVRKLRSLDPLLEIENLRQKDLLPDMTDFKGVAKSVVRLQEMYLMTPKELTDGNVTELVRSPVKLTASDCMYLGETAEELTENNTLPQTALLWNEAGIILAENDTTQQDTAQLLQERHKVLFERSQNSTLAPEAYLSENKDIFNKTLDADSDRGYVEKIFRRLCRGEKIRAPSMDAESYCYLRHGPHPYMKLRPLKLEVKNQDPYLVVMHDVVGEREIEVLKEQARLRFAPSTHVVPNVTATATSDIRVSITSWLTDTHTPSLTKRIEIFLGLEVNISAWHAEEYQVLNYGIGGHYWVHKDYFEDARSDWMFNLTGNRIATLMFYLNDVDVGGYTAFPYMGVSLSPIKGAAAFWWNLRTGGEGDFKTSHGGCPVIYGTKWVANKWFREQGQMFRVPCRGDPSHVVGQL